MFKRRNTLFLLHRGVRASSHTLHQIHHNPTFNVRLTDYEFKERVELSQLKEGFFVTLWGGMGV